MSRVNMYTLGPTHLSVRYNEAYSLDHTEGYTVLIIVSLLLILQTFRYWFVQGAPAGQLRKKSADEDSMRWGKSLGFPAPNAAKPFPTTGEGTNLGTAGSKPSWDPKG